MQNYPTPKRLVLIGGVRSNDVTLPVVRAYIVKLVFVV